MKSQRVAEIQEELRKLKSGEHTDEALSRKYLELFLERQKDLDLSEEQAQDIGTRFEAIIEDLRDPFRPWKFSNATAAVLEATLNLYDVREECNKARELEVLEAEIEIINVKELLAKKYLHVEQSNEILLHHPDDSQNKLTQKALIAQINYSTQFLVVKGVASENLAQQQSPLDIYFQKARELGYDRRDEDYGIEIKWESQDAKLRFLELEMNMAELEEGLGDEVSKSPQMWGYLNEQSQVRLWQTEAMLQNEGRDKALDGELTLIQKTEQLRIARAEIMADHYLQISSRDNPAPIAGEKLFNQIQGLRVARWHFLTENAEGQLKDSRQELLDLEDIKLRFEGRSLELQEELEKENEKLPPDRQRINEIKILRDIEDGNAEKFKKVQDLRFLQQEEPENAKKIQCVNLEIEVIAQKIALAEAVDDTADKNAIAAFVAWKDAPSKRTELRFKNAVEASEDGNLKQAMQDFEGVNKRHDFTVAMNAVEEEIEERGNNSATAADDPNTEIDASGLRVLKIRRGIIAAKYDEDEDLVKKLTVFSRLEICNNGLLEHMARKDDWDDKHQTWDDRLEEINLNYDRAKLLEQQLEENDAEKLQVIAEKLSNVSQKIVNNSDILRNRDVIANKSPFPEQAELLDLELGVLEAKSRLLSIQSNLLNATEPQSDVEKLKEFLAKAEVEKLVAEQKFQVSRLEIEYLEGNYRSEEELADIRREVKNIDKRRLDNHERLAGSLYLEEEGREILKLENERWVELKENLLEILSVNKNYEATMGAAHQVARSSIAALIVAEATLVLLGEIVAQNNSDLATSTLNWQQVIDETRFGKNNSEFVTAARANWESDVGTYGDQQTLKAKKDFDLAGVEVNLVKAEIKIAESVLNHERAEHSLRSLLGIGDDLEEDAPEGASISSAEPLKPDLKKIAQERISLLEAENSISFSEELLEALKSGMVSLRLSELQLHVDKQEKVVLERTRDAINDPSLQPLIAPQQIKVEIIEAAIKLTVAESELSDSKKEWNEKKGQVESNLWDQANLVNELSGNRPLESITLEGAVVLLERLEAKTTPSGEAMDAARELKLAIVEMAKFKSESLWLEGGDTNANVDKIKLLEQSLGMEDGYLLKSPKSEKCHNCNVNDTAVKVASCEMDVSYAKETLIKSDGADSERLSLNCLIQEKRYYEAALQRKVAEKEYDVVGKDDKFLNTSNKIQLEKLRAVEAREFFQVRIDDSALGLATGKVVQSKHEQNLRDLEIKISDQAALIVKYDLLSERLRMPAISSQKQGSAKQLKEERLTSAIASFGGVKKLEEVVWKGKDAASKHQKNEGEIESSKKSLDDWNQAAVVVKGGVAWERHERGHWEKDGSDEKVKWNSGLSSSWDENRVASKGKVKWSRELRPKKMDVESDVIDTASVKSVPDTSPTEARAVALILIDPKSPGDAFVGTDRSNKFRVAAFCYKSDREIAETMAEIVCYAALKNGISIKDATEVIKGARETGGVSNKYTSKSRSYSESDSDDLNAKKFSKLFQKTCEECGIYSGRETKPGKIVVGLRTAFVPKEVLSLLEKRSETVVTEETTNALNDKRGKADKGKREPSEFQRR